MTSTLPNRKSKVLSALLAVLVSCGLTALLLAIVYALRGIWPFGTDDVAYMDAAQFYIPGYYSTWDELHGTALYGTWKTILDPHYWTFYLVSRDHVLEGMSLYVGTWLLVIAACSSAALSCRFPRIGVLWRSVFTLLYTFSGFVLQYYSNFNWLELAAAFPLLLLGLESLLREGKYVLYTLMYVYYLRFGIYFAYMVTIYILFFSLGYCLIVLPKEKRGDRIFRLGAATAVAIGLCMRTATQNAAQITSSARFEENLDTGIETGMTTWNITNTRHTFLMLMGMALPAALLARTIRRQRTAPEQTRPARRRAIRFYCYILGVFALPMVFTNIDTAWHFGQYNFFPMRYGYMLPATLVAGGCLALEDEAAYPIPPTLNGPARRPWLPWAAAAVSGAGILLLAPRLARIFREYGACFLTSLGAAGYLRYFAMYVACGALFAVLYYALFRLGPRRTVWAVAAVVLFQLGANAWGNIAPNDDHTYTHEYDPSYIETSEQLYDYFRAHPTPMPTFVKNVDNCLNAGYPAIAGVSALSSVSSGNTADLLSFYRALGYTTNYFRILDTGGTVFTDMILSVDRVLSALPLDEDLYLPGDTVDGVQIGSSRYAPLQCAIYSGDVMDHFFEQKTIPDRLNVLYAALTDSDEPLVPDVTPEIAVTGEGMRQYTLTYELDAPAFLYLAVDGMAMNITANGRPIAVPSYLNLTNTVYPAPFNSNLLCLGLAEAGTATVQFSSSMDLTAEDLTLFGLDKAALDDFPERAGLDDIVLTQTDDGYTITATAARDGQWLVLPTINLSPYACTVNGEPPAYNYFANIRLSIRLEKGENTVVFSPIAAQPQSQSQPRFTIPRDRLLSTAVLALALLWLVLRRLFPKLQTLVLPRFIYIIVQAMFYAVVAGVVCFVIIAPMYNLITNGQIIWF